MAVNEHRSTDPEEKVTIGTKVRPEVKEGLEEIAIEESEPGNRRTISDILRELTHDFLDIEEPVPSEPEPDDTPELEA